MSKIKSLELRENRLELSRTITRRRILSPLCLPIPPLPQMYKIIIQKIINKNQ